MKLCFLRALPLVIFGALLLHVTVVAAPEAHARPADDFTLIIIHTNDLHSHDEPYRLDGKIVGGAGRIAHVIRQLKEKNKDALVVDAGDIFQGSMLYTHYHGAVEVELLNKLGYDIYTIGNHEFDDGPENLGAQLKNAKFDVVNANMDASKVAELEKVIKLSVVKKVGGQKIGFVGAITPDLETLANKLAPVKLKAKGSNWTDPIKAEVEKLKSEGVDKIVMVTHVGLNMERNLAKAIPDVDVIIGGHSHTRLTKPVIEHHADGTTTTIVQTGCYGRSVGCLKVTFDDKGVVEPKKTAYRLTDLDANIAEDADLTKYVAEMAKPLPEDRHMVIATCSKTFPRKNLLSDSAIGDLVCDALVDSGKEYGVTVAMHNRGGIRGNLQEGPLTNADIQQIFPFDNFVVFATVNGATLKRALEHSIAEGLGGRFLDVAGLKFAYDTKRKPGEKLIFVMVKDLKGNWAAIEDTGKYKIAMNHYNFDGGEGYDFSGAENVTTTKMRMSELMCSYLAKVKNVAPLPPDRIVAVREGLLEIGARDSVSESKAAPSDSRKTGGSADSRKTGWSAGSLKLNGAAPSARLSLVAGSGRGVSTVYSAFPVPVENAHVISTGLKASPEGAYSWDDVSHLAERYACPKNGGDVWFCVVAHPAKNDKANETIITCPVKVKRDRAD